VATYQTLIGFVGGHRDAGGEAIRLDRTDLDLAAGIITVRQSKFGKTRQLSMHPTALRGYLRLRDQLHPSPGTAAVSISPADTRLLYCNVHSTWKLQAGSAGLPAAHPRSRHSFAVASFWTQPPPGKTARPG
jgi:integrase